MSASRRERPNCCGECPSVLGKPAQRVGVHSAKLRLPRLINPHTQQIKTTQPNRCGCQPKQNRYAELARAVSGLLNLHPLESSFVNLLTALVFDPNLLPCVPPALDNLKRAFGIAGLRFNNPGRHVAPFVIPQLPTRAQERTDSNKPDAASVRGILVGPLPTSFHQPCFDPSQRRPM